jgi:hypothetical protein
MSAKRYRSIAYDPLPEVDFMSDGVINFSDNPEPVALRPAPALAVIPALPALPPPALVVVIVIVVIFIVVIVVVGGGVGGNDM